MPRENLATRIFGSSTLNMAGLCLILLLLIVAFSRALWRDRDLRTEMHALQNDVEAEQTEQERMQKLLTYLKSSDYIEAQARKTYGFAKPGEQVVVFQDGGTVSKNAVVHEKTNPAKWFSYFFDSVKK